ncbi:MAG: hypothetical protein ABW203_05475 [Novosphingobium sp.]
MYVVLALGSLLLVGSGLRRRGGRESWKRLVGMAVLWAVIIAIIAAAFGLIAGR